MSEDSGQNGGIYSWYQNRRRLRDIREFAHRVAQALSKNPPLKEPDSLRETLEELQTAVGARDIERAEPAARRLEELVQAEPDLKVKTWARDNFEALVWAILLALFIRTFFFQAFKIPSSSMEDTLLIGDHLFVNKITYGLFIPFVRKELVNFGDPERGDIIVFIAPKPRPEDQIEYIKRVIGLPGDIVQVKNKVVFINGQLAVEPYAQVIDRPMPLDNFGPEKVPPDHYFVMGDNRDFSSDSRDWGYVPRENILGRASRIYWSSQGCFPFADNGPCDVRWSRFGSGFDMSGPKLVDPKSLNLQ